MVKSGLGTDGEGIRASKDVENHVADDFVVAHKVWVFFLCGEKAIDEVFLILEFIEILHALRKPLDCIPCSDCEIVKLVEPSQMWVFAEQLIERWNLPNLRTVNGLRDPKFVGDLQQRSTS